MDTEKRFAILIDGDNISAEYIKTILDEISNKGIATYKRIYGDWTKPNLGKWKEILLEYSITPMQQYSYTTGKNATDSAMIIDAMDILYSGKVQGVCLATSDSDFTKLASRLRESGMVVIGMGEEKTPRPFVSACDEFKFVDKLSKKVEKVSASHVDKSNGLKSKKADAKKTNTPEAKNDKTSQTDLETIRQTIVEVINDNSDDNGYILVSDIGNIISKRYVDFDVRNFGYKKMVPLLDSLSLFEIKMIKDVDNKKHPNAQIAYIKLKD
ncbi:MAG: NYN domain-containing protein [Peptostreptococcaceae bacterium]|nr:NYN domain-containing protein [Peptostreptococcaceae bacterium]